MFFLVVLLVQHYHGTKGSLKENMNDIKMNIILQETSNSHLEVQIFGSLYLVIQNNGTRETADNVYLFFSY